MKLNFFCISLLLFGISKVNGQSDEKKFFLRPLIGITASQVDGDNFAGYNKAGIVGGFGIGRSINDNWTASFGLYFLQKGARKNANPKMGDLTTYRFNINYIDVPVFFTYKYKLLDFYAGISASYLINYKEDWTNAPSNYNHNMHKVDIGWLCGFEKDLGNGAFLGLKLNYSAVPMRDFFSSSAQPQLIYYNFWGRLFNRGFYNNVFSVYVCKTLNPGSQK